MSSEAGQTFAAVARLYAPSAVETPTAPRRLGPVTSTSSHLVVLRRAFLDAVRPLVAGCGGGGGRRPATLGSREAVTAAAQRRTHTVGVPYTTARTDRYTVHVDK